MALVESIGDPTLTVGLSFTAIAIKLRPARWPRRCAGRRPSSTWPTATRRKATSFSGRRWRLALARAAPPDGRWAVPGWRDDSTGRWPWPAAPTRCRMPGSSHTPTASAIPAGVLLADDAALRDIEEALEISRAIERGFRAGLPGSRWVSRWCTGTPGRARARTGGAGAGPRHVPGGAVLPGDLPLRRRVHRPGAGQARRSRWRATSQMRAAVDDLFSSGTARLLRLGATGVLVETLLERGADGDVAEAEAAIDRLAAAPADEGLADTRHLAAAAAGAAGAGPRRR